MRDDRERMLDIIALACGRMTRGVRPLSPVWFGIGDDDPRNSSIMP